MYVPRQLFLAGKRESVALQGPRKKHIPNWQKKGGARTKHDKSSLFFFLPPALRNTDGGKKGKHFFPFPLRVKNTVYFSFSTPPPSPSVFFFTVISGQKKERKDGKPTLFLSCKEKKRGKGEWWKVKDCPPGNFGFSFAPPYVQYSLRHSRKCTKEIEFSCLFV